MVDLVPIGVEIPMIDNGGSLKKQFNEVIYINLLMILYSIVNQVQ